VSPGRTVHIHYLRPPDRLQVYVQELVVDHPEVKVSYQPDTPVERPLRVGGATILEPGSPVVWFTFPGRWHDIGRFHTADGTFTGLYANILTPPVLESAGQGPASAEPGAVVRWDTTDLFLDVWLGPGGDLEVLDREQLDEALAHGWVDEGTARRARDEVERIRAAHDQGRWPPPVVDAWTLERVRRIGDVRAR